MRQTPPQQSRAGLAVLTLPLLAQQPAPRERGSLRGTLLRGHERDHECERLHECPTVTTIPERATVTPTEDRCDT